MIDRRRVLMAGSIATALAVASTLGVAAIAGTFRGGWVSPSGECTAPALPGALVVHELIVLPLPAGQRIGHREVKSDGRVDETGSLGEAAKPCGDGAGDGIHPGGLSWDHTPASAWNLRDVLQHSGALRSWYVPHPGCDLDPHHERGGRSSRGLLSDHVKG